MSAFDPKTLLSAIEAIRQIELPVLLDRPFVRKKKDLLAAIEELRQHLDLIETALRGIEIPTYVFDLSNPVIIGGMAVHELGEQPRHSLASLPRFYGSGVYVLYYSGLDTTYEAISGTECPIYAGSASPKNKIAESPKKQYEALYKRLTHHLNKSIRFAKTTLNDADFSCRYLVVQTGLELAAEQFLLRRFHPVWNKICPGFGKHGDKSDRQTELSNWDLIHPGRPFAKGQSSKKKQKNVEAQTAETVRLSIKNHFVTLLHEHPAIWGKRFNQDWVKKQASS